MTVNDVASFLVALLTLISPLAILALAIKSQHRHNRFRDRRPNRRKRR